MPWQEYFKKIIFKCKVLSACDLTAVNMLYIHDFKVKIQNTSHYAFPQN